MMTGMRKTGWIALLLLLLLALVTGAACAEDAVSAEPAENFTYNVTDEVNCTITSYTGSAVQLVMPETLDGYTVTAIAANAFANNRTLTSVVMPEGLLSIGERAFSDCTSLVSIQLPNGLTTIDQYAFNNCGSMTSLTLPESLLSIGNYAFYKCAFTSIELPDALQSIGLNAFANGSLESLTTGASLTTIGSSAFSGNTKLKSLDLSASTGLTELPSSCFRSSALTSVKFPSSLTTLGEYCFSNGTFTSFTIPDSVTTISSSAFSDCKSLETVVLPKNWSSVRGTGSSYIPSPFIGCLNLKNIVFPEGMKTIPSYAFSKLKLNAPIDLVLPDSIETIGSYAFTEAQCFSSIKAGKGLRTLSSYAFNETENLVNVDLSACANLKIIGEYAFYKCKALTEAKLPPALTTISKYAFADCTMLADVHLPDSITTLRERSFGSCSSLKTINFPQNCTVTSGSGSAYSPFEHSGLTSVTIPQGVTTIPEKAFSNVSNLRTIELPDSVTIIGANAFYKSGLREIKLSEGLTHIYDHAFAYTPLTEINLPDSMRYIDSYVFSHCDKLKKVSLSRDLINIGSWAFSGCYALESISMPDNAISLGDSLFSGCSSLKSVTLSQSLKHIPKSAFSGCAALESIVIPGSLMDIRSGAFSGCTELQAVYFPQSDMIIESGALQKTDKLTIYCYHKTTAYNYAINNEIPYVLLDVEPVENFIYSPIDETTCEITGYTGTSAELTIPATLDGYAVVAIGKEAFYGNTTLASVTLPEGVLSIGENAFSNCTRLEKVVLPDSVTMIHSTAFRYCTSLTSLNVPLGWTTLSGTSSPFRYCTSLTKIVIPEGMTAVPDYAFSDVSSIAEISFPDGLISIGRQAFYNCDGLVSLTLPESVTTLGQEAFGNCSNLSELTYPIGWTTTITSYPQRSPFDSCTKLTSIVVPEGVTTIPNYAFYSLSSLTSVTLPDSLVSIGAYAFARTSLTSVETGTSLTTLGSSAFSDVTTLVSLDLSASIGLTTIPSNCFNATAVSAPKFPASLTTLGSGAFASGLFTSFDIPDSVTTITVTAFKNCIHLETIKLSKNWVNTPASGTSNTYSPFDGCTALKTIIFPEGMTSIPYAAFSHLRLTQPIDLVLPDWIESIGAYAFTESTGIASVKTGKGLTSIGERAFYKNTGLTKADLSASTSLTTLSPYVFNGCSVLTDVALPQSLTTIQRYAFSDCSSLTSFDFPDSITTLEDSIFYGCTSLKSIDYPINWNSVGSSSSSPFRGSVITSITVPDGLTAIPNYAFSAVSSLQSVVLPDSLTSISTGAFTGTSLTEIEIPENVVSIRADAFSSTDLIEIEIPESVTSLGASVFSNCSSLKKATIRGRITSLNSYTFSQCTSLETIVLPNTLTSLSGYGAFLSCTSLTSIDLPFGLISLGENVFKDCTALERIEIPDTVSSIGTSAFSNCTALKEVKLPVNLYQIYAGAFSGCTSLESIHLPDSLTLIGQNAFSGCTSLSSVNFPRGWKDVPTSSGIIINFRSPFVNCPALKSITIPEGVTSIPDYAFSHVTSLESVNIPESVTVIGNAAFHDTNAFIELILPEGLTKISYSSFQGVPTLTSVVLPESIATLESSAFYACENLQSIYFPQKNLSLASGALLECPNLTIYCYDKTTAHTYAINNNIPYVLLDDHEHDYQLVYQSNPTCTGSGIKQWRCSLCGYTYKESIASPGHSWSEWETVKEPTLLESGLRQRVCSVCTRKETEVIKQLELPDEWKDQYGYTTFTVVNANTNAPISGASLTIRLDEDYELTISTDYSGKVTQLLPIGSYKVFVYRSGLMSRTIPITVTSGECAIPAIGLSDSDFVDANISVKEMTYQEIIDAGIDTEDPTNQHVYKYEVGLNFSPDVDTLKLVYYLNENGEIINPPITVPNQQWRPSGSGYCYEDDEGTAISVYPVSEDFYLIIHGEVRWLKEMFDVEMLVINKSLTDTLEDCTATLTLPDGLSLAAMTGEAQNASIDLGVIEKGGQKSAHWYVRGDEEGTYSVSASLTGTMQPFGETIERTYQAEDAIHVYAGSALALTCYVPDTAYYGQDYVMRAVLTNVSDRTLYNVSALLARGRSGKYTHCSNGMVLESVYLAKDETLSSSFAQTFLPGDTLEVEIAVPVDFQSFIVAGEVEAIAQTLRALEKLENAMTVFTAPGDAERFGDYLALLQRMADAGKLADDPGERLQTIAMAAGIEQLLEKNAGSAAHMEAAYRELHNRITTLPIRYQLAASAIGLVDGSEIPVEIIPVHENRTAWVSTADRYLHSFTSAVCNGITDESITAAADALACSDSAETVKAVEGVKQIVLVHTAQAEGEITVWSENGTLGIRPIEVGGTVENGVYTLYGGSHIEVTPGSADDILYVTTNGVTKSIAFDVSPAHTCAGEWTVVYHATEYTSGYEVLLCSECGLTLETRRTSSCGNHTFSEYHTDAEPAHGLFGIQTRVCEECHVLEYRLIDENGAVEYEITFDANGGEGIMPVLTVGCGETAVLLHNGFTHESQQFVCWNTEPDGSGINYAPGTEIEPAGSMTLYALWSESGLLEYDMSAVRLEPDFFPYDGEEHEVFIVGLPEGVTIVSIEGNRATEIGEYNVTAVLAAADEFHAAPVLPELKWVISSMLRYDGETSKVYDGTSALPGSFFALGDAPISLHFAALNADETVLPLNEAPENVGRYRATAWLTVGTFTETLDVDYEILHREAVIIPEPVRHEYDGHPAVSKAGSASNLADGHRLALLRLESTQILPSLYESETYTILEAQIVDENGADVTGNYLLTCAPGELAITKRRAYVTTDDAEAVYDGMPHRAETFRGENLLEGHRIVDVIHPHSLTDAGELTGLLPEGGRIIDEEGVDLGHLYEIEYAPYSLTVHPRPLTVAYDDYEREYNGYSGGYTNVIIDNVVEGHEVTHWLNAPSVTTPGVYKDHFLPTNIAVLGWDGEDVTANYTITAIAGDMIITPRKLTVTVHDVTADFDGQPHGAETWSADRLVAGHELTSVTTAGSASEPGVYPDLLTASDAVILSRSGKDVTSYYDITYVPGTLSIIGNAGTPVSYLRLSAHSIHLAEGERVRVIAEVLPSDASNTGVSWQSSDESILSVTDEGIITRLKEGEAFITAAALDGSGVTAVCLVHDDDLPRLRLPAAIRILADEAHAGDTALKCVDLTAAQAPEIGAKTFAGCEALVKVLLPEGTTMAADAFDGSENTVLFVHDDAGAQYAAVTGLAYVVAVE